MKEIDRETELRDFLASRKEHRRARRVAAYVVGSVFFGSAIIFSWVGVFIEGKAANLKEMTTFLSWLSGAVAAGFGWYLRESRQEASQVLEWFRKDESVK